MFGRITLFCYSSLLIYLFIFFISYIFISVIRFSPCFLRLFVALLTSSNMFAFKFWHTAQSTEYESLYCLLETTGSLSRPVIQASPPYLASVLCQPTITNVINRLFCSNDYTHNVFLVPNTFFSFYSMNQLKQAFQVIEIITLSSGQLLWAYYNMLL